MVVGKEDCHWEGHSAALNGRSEDTQKKAEVERQLRGDLCHLYGDGRGCEREVDPGYTGNGTENLLMDGMWV